MSNIAHNYGHWTFWEPYDPLSTPPTFGTHKCVFDGLNKTITVTPGVTELDIQTDVYSDWKEWVLAGNANWDPAIRTIGGDPTVQGQKAGDQYFLFNGWKLYVDLTEVAVTGVLFSDDFNSAYYDLVGKIQYPALVSSIVNTVSVGGGTSTTAQEVWEYATRTLTSGASLDPTEIAQAVWDASTTSHNTIGTFGHLVNELGFLEKQIWVNLELGSNGDGSQELPFNNINDAIDKAETDGIRVIDLIGDITLSRNFNNFILKGIGEPEVDFNGQSIKNSKFVNCRIKGAYTNGANARFEDCELLDGAFLEGTYDHCDLSGDLTCQADSIVLMKDCVSSIPGTGRPTISMNAASTAQLSMRGYSGGMTISDCNNALDRVTVEMHPGATTFDSSCTDGVMVVRGVGVFVDESAGANVFNQSLNVISIESTVLPHLAVINEGVKKASLLIPHTDMLVLGQPYELPEDILLESEAADPNAGVVWDGGDFE